MPTKKSKTVPARTSGGTDEVENFLATLNHPSKREILALRAIIRGVDTTVRESIKWNAPSFHTSEDFATFHLRHKGGVQLVLHMGVKARTNVGARTAIVDPESLLEWRSADRATVTFRNLQEIVSRQRAFVKVLRQWLTFV